MKAIQFNQPCSKCGYSLRGVTSGSCPECGEPSPDYGQRGPVCPTCRCDMTGSMPTECGGCGRTIDPLLCCGEFIVFDDDKMLVVQFKYARVLLYNFPAFGNYRPLLEIKRKHHPLVVIPMADVRSLDLWYENERFKRDSFGEVVQSKEMFSHRGIYVYTRDGVLQIEKDFPCFETVQAVFQDIADQTSNGIMGRRPLRNGSIVLGIVLVIGLFIGWRMGALCFFDC